MSYWYWVIINRLTGKGRGLVLSVLSTSCLWGGSFSATGHWLGILASLWSVGLWFGN